MHKYTTDELVSQKLSPEGFKKLKRNPIVFVLHNIRSLQNVGLFFRLADAVLAEKIYLTGFTGFPNSSIHAENEINKTAIKTVPFVPWEQSLDLSQIIERLKNLNYQIVGIEQTDVSIDYKNVDFKFPVALIFGHEREGLKEEFLEKCDLIVHIPMLGMGNSHNVAMAGAIVSYFILTNVVNLKT